MPQTAQELASALERDLAWIASELGSRIAEAAPVSPLRGLDRPRAAFRLRLEDGRELKLRRMRSPERAAELAQLTEQLRDLGVPRVVLRREEALVAEWVPGSPQCESPAEPGRLEEAARLLGRIHATPRFDGFALPALRPVDAELLALEEELAALVRGSRLAPETAARLLAAARERAPGRALHGIVHGDFCAENLVIDREGRLRVIDNEGIEVGPLARDLARVQTRWPMPAADWDRFLAAYRSAAGSEAAGEDLAVWRIRSRVRSAWYRATHGMSGAEEALAELRRPLEDL
jgi:aminoglycoside phosphotransferase (APT) family kinase protein